MSDSSGGSRTGGSSDEPNGSARGKGSRRGRRNRSQGRAQGRAQSAGTPAAAPAAGASSESNGAAATGGKGRGRGRAKGGAAGVSLRTVRETSAGGLVIAGIDGPKDGQVAALIGRTDRRGRMLWSLPKGHIEQGETAEQTAIREVAEETGIRGSVLAALGSIDYWFVTEGRRVHKTVHHYLMRSLGGELSDDDVEVTEVAWVPLGELPTRLAYADERRLAEVAGDLIDKLHSGGPESLPPLPQSTPRRRPQTHSSTHRTPARRTGRGPQQ
ncbi:MULTISPECIES: NUDIX hydrolase [unclassified Mycobacterium]|uniref:NUDIX hydrolase n=1 Tax=unclassified Mycobacterium TaxID=2642494 RepID=UPI001115C4FC|nr:MULTISPECIES: NUDIX hydrolase [unclassified Mycobacterium]